MNSWGASYFYKSFSRVYHRVIPSIPRVIPGVFPRGFRVFPGFSPRFSTLFTQGIYQISHGNRSCQKLRMVNKQRNTGIWDWIYQVDSWVLGRIHYIVMWKGGHIFISHFLVIFRGFLGFLGYKSNFTGYAISRQKLERVINRIIVSYKIPGLC